VHGLLSQIKTGVAEMMCHFCQNIATEKHHVTYFPEETIGVCAFHGDQIHLHPFEYAQYIKYRRGDASAFYEQNKRIGKFCIAISKARRRERRR